MPPLVNRELVPQSRTTSLHSAHTWFGRGYTAAYAGIRATVCLLALHTLAVPAHATLDPTKAISQYTHQVWDSGSGLPQSSVLSIAQTPDGYLWLGTEEGLVRFDGVRFTVFDKRNTAGLLNDYIHALLLDSQGNLWIGTDGGLSRLRNGKIVSYSKRNGLPSDAITSLISGSPRQNLDWNGWRRAGSS